MGDFVSVYAPEGVCEDVARVAAGRLAPASGSVEFMGRDFETMSPRERERLWRGAIAVVPSIPHVESGATVGENLAYAVAFRTGDMGQAGRVAQQALLDVGLGDCAGAMPAELALRELRWLTLLRGLLMRPQLLVVEHGAIDVSAADEVRSMARHILGAVGDAGTGVLWPTTSARAASSAGRMLIFSQGLLHDADAEHPGAAPSV